MYKIFAILLVAVVAGGVNGATKPVNEVSRALLGDPEGTANINCKSHNLPNTDTQNYSTDMR